MRAIVLSCDRYRPFTDHMIFQYDKVWPSHPFQFRVPYQEIQPTYSTDAVEYRVTPPGIKPTVLTLLDDLSDDETIYWCIDDKYPIKLAVPRIEAIYRWFAEKAARDVSGVLFCRPGKMREGDILSEGTTTDDSGQTYRERKGYNGIWIHQFLRVKVLRHLFNALPDDIPVAKIMDRLKENVTKPIEHRLFVTTQGYAIFGESTRYGTMTINCYRSMLESGLPLPESFSGVIEKEIVKGRMDNDV